MRRIPVRSMAMWTNIGIKGCPIDWSGRTAMLIESNMRSGTMGFRCPQEMLFFPAMKSVTIYSDGGCQGNPGPGGWGAILIYGSIRKTLSGARAATTNNRMELTACIEALKALKEPCRVELHTDSQYVQRGMSEWLPKWKAKGWKRGKESIKNQDLWKRLDQEAARHELSWKWVRGHAGHPENERCDELANLAIADLRNRFSKAELQEALTVFQEGATTGLF